jgi:hypothetical protein
MCSRDVWIPLVFHLSNRCLAVLLVECVLAGRLVGAGLLRLDATTRRASSAPFEWPRAVALQSHKDRHEAHLCKQPTRQSTGVYGPDSLQTTAGAGCLYDSCVRRFKGKRPQGRLRLAVFGRFICAFLLRRLLPC